jgi:hypothetical protein
MQTIMDVSYNVSFGPIFIPIPTIALSEHLSLELRYHSIGGFFQSLTSKLKYTIANDKNAMLKKKILNLFFLAFFYRYADPSRMTCSSLSKCRHVAR